MQVLGHGDDSSELVEFLMLRLSESTARLYIEDLLEWIESESLINVSRSLDAVEATLSYLEGTRGGLTRKGAAHFVGALLEALREADMSNDDELVHRVLSVQDRSLVLGIDGAQEMLNALSQRTD
jgi:hypothetical protein